jgi:hypothetical protein
MGFSKTLLKFSVFISRRWFMLKALIATGAVLAMVSVAAAADLPRAQPVYSQAPVGKMPIGKYPVIGKLPGKYPVGKYPTAAPVVTKG